LTDGRIELVALKKNFSKLHVVAMQQIDLSRLTTLASVIYGPIEISKKVSEFVVANDMKKSFTIVASSIYTECNDESLLRFVTLQLWLCLKSAKVMVAHIFQTSCFELKTLHLNDQIIPPEIDSQHDYLADIVRKRDWRSRLIYWLGSFFAFAMIFGGLYVHFKNSKILSELISERKSLEVVNQVARAKDKDLVCLQKACSDQEKILVKLQKLASKKPYYSSFLQSISREIPALVWLTDLWVGNQKVGNGGKGPSLLCFRVKGSAVKAQDITTFVGRLSKIPQIEKMTLTNLEEKGLGRLAYCFSLEGTLRR
jgi:hypothetical protein